MVSFQNIPIYSCLFLINIFYSISILEVPLKTIKVKGIPKYRNITKIESGKQILMNNTVLFYEEGDSVISNDLLFLANIKVGSNHQEFNLVLDTGSSVLWVAQYGCAGENAITHFFNPSDSSTSKSTGQSFEIEYGTGYCTGIFYNDNVRYLSNSDFNMYFGVASRADFLATGADGIIGLAKSYQQEALSFVHMLKKSGVTDSLAFSFKFELDVFESDVEGKMYIGRHDDFSKSEVKSCPLVSYKSDTFWACQLDSFSIKGSSHEAISSRSTGVIFDTGTNAIFLPLQYLEDIQGKLANFGCRTYKSNGNYYILCEASGDVPDLNFKFNNQDLTLPKEYVFTYATTDKKYVISSIIFTNEDLALIGSVFFYVYHTLFDEENQELKFILNDGKIGGLSTFVIILIVVASIATVLIIAYVIYYCVKKRKEQNMLVGSSRNNYSEPLFNY